MRFLFASFDCYCVVFATDQTQFNCGTFQWRASIIVFFFCFSVATSAQTNRLLDPVSFWMRHERNWNLGSYPNNTITRRYRQTGVTLDTRLAGIVLSRKRSTQSTWSFAAEFVRTLVHPSNGACTHEHTSNGPSPARRNISTGGPAAGSVPHVLYGFACGVLEGSPAERRHARVSKLRNLPVALLVSVCHIGNSTSNMYSVPPCIVRCVMSTS